MQSDETFIQKTFELINELTGAVTFIPIKVLYISSTREINISRAIVDIHISGFNLERSLIFYLDNNKRLFVHVGTFPFPKGFELLLKFELFLETTIKLRFRKISSPNSPKGEKKNEKSTVANNEKPKPPSQSQGKRTRKQKTIQEVQKLVSSWRAFFQMTDQQGKKLYTLQTAADKLGMQKKTLDDYYYKIKSAHTHGFDFQKYKNQKIGVLRQFVKESKKNQLGKTSMSTYNGGFCNNGAGSSTYSGSGVGTSYAGSYQQPFPQKPPEDEIDKYFAKDSEESSSDSEQSE